jgi:hypothetical protein
MAKPGFGGGRLNGSPVSSTVAPNDVSKSMQFNYIYGRIREKVEVNKKQNIPRDLLLLLQPSGVSRPSAARLVKQRAYGCRSNKGSYRHTKPNVGQQS